MRHPTTLWLAVLSVIAADAAPGAVERFRYERPAVLDAPGPHSLPVDVPLLAGARPFRIDAHALPPGRSARFVARGGLCDLRLFDVQGRELPYLLVEPPLPAPEWRKSPLLLPLPASRKESGLEADLGASLTIDRVRLEGLPVPFLKRVAVDGSGDRARWTRLVPQATLFDLPDSELRQLELGFASGAFRYLRLTWDDRSSARLPLPRALLVRLARADAPARPPRAAPLGFERRQSEPGKSRFRLRLPAAGLPIVALRLSVGGEHLLRSARVSEARLQGDSATPVTLGLATLRRATRDALQADELRIPITPPTTTELELEVDDGDNPALELLLVSAELAELPWIYLEVGAAQTVVARWGGGDRVAPRYDLESERERVSRTAPPPGRWGERSTPLPEASPTEAARAGAGPSVDVSRFSHVRVLSQGPPGLVAVPLDAAVLAHSAFGERGSFADLRVVDAAERQLAYLVERRAEPLVVALPAFTPEPGKRFGPGVSAFRLRLPEAGLPPARLVLRTTARVFDRQLELLAVRKRPRERTPLTDTVASALWIHADPDLAARPLTLDVPRLPSAEAILLVHEGDNSPLPLGAPELLLPAYAIRFFRPQHGELRLVYGDRQLPPPRYDLALLGPSILASPALEVSLSAERERAPGSPVILGPKGFWAVMIAAVVALLLLIGGLVRRAGPDRHGEP